MRNIRKFVAVAVMSGGLAIGSMNMASAQPAVELPAEILAQIQALSGDENLTALLAFVQDNIALNPAYALQIAAAAAGVNPGAAIDIATTAATAAGSDAGADVLGGIAQAVATASGVDVGDVIASVAVATNSDAASIAAAAAAVDVTAVVPAAGPPGGTPGNPVVPLPDFAAGVVGQTPAPVSQLQDGSPS